MGVVSAAGAASGRAGDRSMTNIEKLAESYRAFLIDDRNLRPLTIALIIIVVVWMAVYLLGGATDRWQAQTSGQIASSPSVVSLSGRDR